MAREIIFTENAPKAVGPYVQAVRSNGMVYVSGQLGIDTAAGRAGRRSRGSGALLHEEPGSHPQAGRNRLYKDC